MYDHRPGLISFKTKYTLLSFFSKGKSTVIPPGEGRLNIYNGFDCQVYVHSPSIHVDHIRPLEMVNVTTTFMSREEIVEIAFYFDPACTLVPKNFEFNTTMTVVNEKVNNFSYTTIYVILYITLNFH